MANAKTEIAVKKEESTAVAKPMNWAEKLAGYAQEAAAEEKVSAGTSITCRSGQLQIGGQPVAGNKLSVVIVGSVFENAYYSDDYDADNPKAPTCFAFAKVEADLTPHDESMEKEHDSCKGCPQNEWGSAAKGKGKACKNIRRLLMVSASPLTIDGVNSGDVAFMKLPVTSGKAWAQYVNTLAAVHKRPPFAVITEIGAVPDPKTQFKITFNHLSNIDDNELLEALHTKNEGSFDQLAVPYAPNAVEEKPKKVVAKGKGKF